VQIEERISDDIDTESDERLMQLVKQSMIAKGENMSKEALEREGLSPGFIARFIALNA
jgi:hypothetical protein